MVVNANSGFVTSTASLQEVVPVSSLMIGGQALTAGRIVTQGGDILSLAAGGTGIVVIGTKTVGAVGQTEEPKKKSAGVRGKSVGMGMGLGLVMKGWGILYLQVSFVVWALWL